MAAPARRYVPDFRVAINGEEIPAALRASVTHLRYDDGHETADRVEIGVANADLRWLRQHIKGLGFRPLDTFIKASGLLPPHVAATSFPEGLFDMDNSLELAMGYAPGELEPLFVGDVTGVEASFPQGGMPSMTLVAHDRLHRMTEGSYARGFGPLPEFVIAQILGAESRLLATIEPTVVAASAAVTAVNLIFNGTGLKQKGQSQLELLTEIAHKYDADFWVDGDVLWVTRFLKEYAPRLTLTWGESLLEFTPKITTVGQAFGVGMKVQLREIPLDFLVKVYWDFDRESLGVVVLPGMAAAGAGDPVFTVIDRPVGSPADIVNSSLKLVHELREKLNNRLTGEATAVGDPRIRAGAVVALDGLGPDFSGNYRVKNASHTLTGAGYLTTFEVQKEILP